MGEIGGPRQAALDGIPFRQQLARHRNLLAAARRLVVAVLNLVDELQRLGVDLVTLGHDDAVILRPRQVLEERRAPVRPGRGRRQDISQRHDRDLIDRLDGPLCRRVVPAQRLDRVADELESNRVAFTCREHVENAATDGELAMFIRRIFPGESRVDQQLGQIDR